MGIEVGMKCVQTKAIKEYAFEFVGTEFEITKSTDVVIMGKSLDGRVTFGIETEKFADFFELIVVPEEIVEEIEEDEDIEEKETFTIVLRNSGVVIELEAFSATIDEIEQSIADEDGAVYILPVGTIRTDEIAVLLRTEE